MSHKSGHIIIESSPATGSDSLVAPDVVGKTSVELNFPAGMDIEERIKQVRHAMRVIDKLDHPDEG